MAGRPLYRRRVWDRVVRSLHWWLTLTLLVQFALAGGILAEEALGLSETGKARLIAMHAGFGLAFGTGLLARILWLFLTPGTGSWRSLLPISREQWKTLRATVRHYLGGFRGEAPFYHAHNPLAGLAYGLFFLVGTSQLATGLGLFTLGEDELGGTWKALHTLGFLLIAGFVVLHLIMVVIHELTEHRGLISAMVNGYKLFTAKEALHHPEIQSD